MICFPRDKNAAKQRALTLSSELNKYITSNEFNTGRFYYAENKDSSYDLKMIIHQDILMDQ